MRRFSLGPTALYLLTVLVLTGCSPLPAGGDPAWANCTQQTVPVHLSATDSTVYRVSGQLCQKGDDLRGARTVQLLVSGLTFDRNYWDIGYQPETYSYVYAANTRGYSTFNIDRLGVGASDHPPADQLTIQAHAYAISQIVSQLRAGKIGGTAYRTVVGVGHSMGAGILQYEAGTVTDRAAVPDYLILSDFLFQTDTTVVTRIGQALYPAADDPRFASAGLPPGYLTTRPGSRGDLFFHPGGTDGTVVNLDEARKQTTTLAERRTLAAARDEAVMRAIQVPILLTVGRYDILDCNDSPGLSCADPAAVVARESSRYSPKTCLAAFVVPDAGHASNLHRHAREAYIFGNDWLDSYTIHGDSGRDSAGCVR